MLSLSAEEGMKMVECYVKARGIDLSAHHIEERGSQYLANLEGISMRAQSIVSKPIVTKYSKTSHSGDS